MSIVHEMTIGEGSPIVSASHWNAQHVSVFSPTRYGAVGNGVIDDTAAIQSAVNAAASAGGGVVVFSAGTYRMNNHVSLPTGLTGRLTITGDGQVTLLPYKACFCHTGSPNSVVRNIEICDLEFNGANVTGRYALIGSYMDGGHGQRKGWDNIYLHDLKMYGLPTDATHVNHVWGVGLTMYHSAEGETLTEIKNVLCERVSVHGGNAGILLTGHKYGTGENLNMRMDNLVFRDCEHIVATHPGVATMSGFHVGQWAAVGRVRYENCRSVNSGDNGIEVNNAQDCIIDNCTFVDAFVAGITIGSYRQPSDVDSSRYLIRGCSDEWTGAAEHQWHRAVVCLEQGYPSGAVVIDGFRLKSTKRTGMFAFGGETIKRIVLRNIICSYDFNEALTSSVWPVCISISDNSPGARHLLESIYVTTTGTVTGAYDFSWRMFSLDGADVNYTIRDCHLDWRLPTTSGWKYGALLGAYEGSHTGALVDGFSIFSAGESRFEDVYSHASNTTDAEHPIIENDCLYTFR